MAAIGVAGWFVQPIVEKIIEFGFVYLKGQVRWKKHVEEELGRLQANLPKIQSVVDFASSQTEISENLKKWLWQLRDAIDEADDVLDDFEYIKHEKQLTKNRKKKRRKLRSIMKSIKKRLVKFGKRVFKRDPNLKRLEEVVKKLDNLSTDVGTFLHLLQNMKQEEQEQQLELDRSRETGYLPKNDIIGRGNEKEFVMRWLSKPSNEEDQTAFYKNISLLSIVGHGGMGKTTLLRHVYEDIKKTNEFDVEMWVCVSTNFDAKKVIADMLEWLTQERPRLESLVTLQESLKSKVNSKKFVLVLDDIWEEKNEEQNKRKWGHVFAPLVSGSLGSKILITTRMDSVASMIAEVIGKKSKTLKVKGLEEKECLQLLERYAFVNEENHSNVHHKLGSIAEKIVKKFSGSPLATKIMGGVVNSDSDERHWEKVLDSDVGEIMPILRLSYTFLSKPLQSCFAFCCIFRQDHVFDKFDLVRMWIALGFIQPSDIRDRETLEDIGERYFDALVKKSFFDKFDDYYKMHDLLHNLAQSVSKHECLRVELDQVLFSKTPETIRHLSLETENQEELKKIGKFKNLRSLFLIYNEDNENVDVITEILNATRSIRLLYIDLKRIPQAIGYLTHLRYLEVAYSNTILEWPTSLCNLYHLQFIILDNELLHLDSWTFPENTNNLSNLRYLNIPKPLFCSIPEIGKLTSLQELDEFKIQNKSGYRIGELEKMNDLQNLSIKYLDNVEDAQEACNAKLSDKKNLTNLSLQWAEHMNCIDLDEKVLDNLQPPSCLHKLVIDGYMGVRSAKWMNKADFISNLEILKLFNCSNWQTLPPFGQLRFLKSLSLFSMCKVERFDNKFDGNDEHCVFPSLEKLYIYNLEALKDLFDSEVVAAAADHRMFPCLTELYLRKCPKLQELPYLPPKLKKLLIREIGWKTLNCCGISKYSTLEELTVQSCPNITSISLTGLAALRDLKIIDCPKLISLGGHQEVETTKNCQLILDCLAINDPSILLIEPLRSIASIQKLNIERNDELVLFPIETEQWFLQHSSSLCELNFIELKSLQSLPSSLESLSSLKTLFVQAVPQLRELPNLPPSLAQLGLIDLANLDCLPSCLSNLSSLKFLYINDVPRLRDLPDLSASSLECLSIRGCHPELKERYRRDEGSDWHKIAHIPDVNIPT